MFSMKSIIAITATALMLVSAIQSTPSFPRINRMDDITFMGYQNNAPNSPFTQLGIRFKGFPKYADSMGFITSIMAKDVLLDLLASPEVADYLRFKDAISVKVACRPGSKSDEDLFKKYQDLYELHPKDGVIDILEGRDGTKCFIIDRKTLVEKYWAKKRSTKE
ncbi:hypothetical protein BDF19DRAFT_428998 [Syncephalis fuscata]|nr:hypothetical protein BDF19DRAFT_428998 [Syncephalis fuscata]